MDYFEKKQVYAALRLTFLFGVVVGVLLVLVIRWLF